MNKKVGIGILGAGPLNMTHHMPSAVHNQNCVFEMLCDLNEERLKRCDNLYHPKKITTNYDEMLNNPDIDLIFIATVPDLQYDLAKRSIESKKHTFVEKPMAETEERCLELGSLAKKNNVQIATGYNRRFSPAMLDLKSIMEKCSVPPIIYYRLVDDMRDGRLGRVLQENRSQLIEETCHIFDLVCWLCNDKPVEVYNMSIPPLSDVTVIRLSKGGVVNIITSGRGTMAWPKEGMEVFLNHGVVRIDDFIEMHTANIEGWPDQVKRYEGYECEGGWLTGYTKLLEWEGLDRLLYYRREWQKIFNEQGLVNMQEFPGERMEFIKSKINKKLPHINYMVNKGWRNADNALIDAIFENKPCQNASAVDAAVSLACAESAVKSGQIHQPISFNLHKWEI